MQCAIEIHSAAYVYVLHVRFAMAVGESQIGSSKLPGVHTTVLYGDPTRPGFFAFLLSVPARTTIERNCGSATL